MEPYVGEGVLRGDRSPSRSDDVVRPAERYGGVLKRILKAVVIGLLVQHGVSLETNVVPSLALLIAQRLPYLGGLLPYFVDRLAFYGLVASILILRLSWMVIAKRWHRELEPHQRSTLSRIFSYVRPHWPYAVGVTAAILASASLELAAPWIISFMVIGRVILGPDVAFLPMVLILLAAVFCANQVASYLKDYLSAALGQKTVHKLRSDAYEHIERLPVRFFDSSRTGDLISRIVSDTSEIEKVLTDDMANLVANAVMVVGAISLLFVVQARAAIYVVPVAVLIVVVVNTFKRAIKRASAQVRVAVAELTARGFEVLSGIRIVKSFQMERSESREFRERSMAIARSKVRLAKLSGVYGSTVDLLTSATLLVVIWSTAPSVLTDVRALLPAFTAFIAFLDRLFKPLVQLSKVNITLQKAIAAADRVFEVMDQAPEVDDSKGLSPPAVEGRIEFDHVSFGYRAGHNVLEDFS